MSFRKSLEFFRRKNKPVENEMSQEDKASLRMKIMMIEIAKEDDNISFPERINVLGSIENTIFRLLPKRIVAINIGLVEGLSGGDLTLRRNGKDMAGDTITLEEIIQNFLS